MSLPLPEVDRIFTRLHAAYTAAWDHRLQCFPIHEQKTLWAHELSGMPLQAIDWALENLPEHCPNVIEFKNLCRAMPRPRVVHVAEASKPSARLAYHLRQIAPIRDEIAAATWRAHIDGKAWAWRLIENHRAGEVVNWTKLHMACDALRVPYPPPSADSLPTPEAYRRQDVKP